jgi:hypothetical protein
MGLPAVVLPDATRLFADGEAIRVDGRSGFVQRVDNVPHTTETPGAPGSHQPDPNDTTVPRQFVPPPPGRRERAAGRLRNIAFAIWGVYLLATFLLPDTWLYHPSLHVLDLGLWPLMRLAGRAATVVLIAGLFAAATMLVQRLFTDNARLLEAKRRAASLTREARRLPADAPRRAALLRLAGPVQWRVAAAAFVPLALMLGPMVMSFTWLHERILPAVRSIAPGSTVQVVAQINSDVRKPVILSAPAPLEIDAAATPAAQTLRPIRETLLRLRDQMKVATPAPDKASAVADWARDEAAREATLASLQAYLDTGVPPQPLRWSIRTPPGVQGRFPLTITAPAAADGRPVTTTLVVGDRPPPAPAAVDGPARSAVRSIEINYPKANAHEDVWTPLRWMPAEWQWVVLYLLAYLPVMFGLRAALRVA